MGQKCNESFNLVERQFIGFIMKSVQGLRLDYLRRQQKFDTEIPTRQPETYLRKDGISCTCEIGMMENEGILDALASLSETQRVVIELVFMQDLTEKSAAEVLNISQQGVHQTKKRALALLAKALKEVRQ